MRTALSRVPQLNVELGLCGCGLDDFPPRFVLKKISCVLSIPVSCPLRVLHTCSVSDVFIFRGCEVLSFWFLIDGEFRDCVLVYRLTSVETKALVWRWTHFYVARFGASCTLWNLDKHFLQNRKCLILCTQYKLFVFLFAVYAQLCTHDSQRDLLSMRYAVLALRVARTCFAHVATCFDFALLCWNNFSTWNIFVQMFLCDCFLTPALSMMRCFYFCLFV